MSNIYFKQVQLKNFMSYETACVDLNKPGYILVNGDNNNPDDSAKSNGCGKSTLFNAISWALTGQTTSGAKDVSNIYLSGQTTATVEFECNGKNYVITRMKNPAKLKIYINGEDKSGKGIRDSEKLLNEYLPEITDSLINSVIILGQGLPQRFTNNTPSGRKEVLENLSKSDFMIDDLKQRISNRKEILSNQLREQEDELLKKTNEVEIYTQYKSQAEQKYSSLEDASTLDEQLNKHRVSYNDLDKQCKSLEFELSSFKKNLDDLYNDMDNLYKEKSDKLSSLELNDTKNIESVISDTKSEIRIKTDELNKLESIVDTCPTCGQKLPDVHKIDTTELVSEIEKLKHNLTDYNNSLDELISKNNEMINNIEIIYQDKQNDIQEKIGECKSEIDHLEGKYSLYTNDIKRLDDMIKDITYKKKTLENTRQECEQEITKYDTLLHDINSEIVVINNVIDNIKTHIDINQKMNTIIKRDFRGYLLTNVIDYISSRCKFYSKQVFNTEKLDFTLDGNNISISYDGKEYEMLSGGEKQKIDVILQLSLRDMLCSYLNFSSNILVLDEITDSLDIIGAQKIFNLISSNLTDVETIYIISHHQDFEIPYDGEIKIVKGSDKISRII